MADQPWNIDRIEKSLAGGNDAILAQFRQRYRAAGLHEIQEVVAGWALIAERTDSLLARAQEAKATGQPLQLNTMVSELRALADELESDGQVHV